MTIVISTRRVIRALAALVAFLVLASVTVKFAEPFLTVRWMKTLVRIFDVDSEQNLPSWFSSVALLAAAALLAVIASGKKRKEPYFLHGWALALIFLGLSVDEMVSIHELTIGTVRRTLRVGGIFYFAWVIPGMIFVALFALAYLKFLRDLPASTRNQFLGAGTVYVAGAIGFEMLGGRQAAALLKQGIPYETQFSYWALATVEELLEMIGIVLFIRALLLYLSRLGELSIRVVPQRLETTPPPASEERQTG